MTSKQQLFLSGQLPGPSSPGAADASIPVFSVRQLANTSWVGTISKLGSTNSTDAVSLIMEKDGVDPAQQINFSVVSSSWGNSSGLNMFMTAKADLTSENAVLQYSGIATASQQLASMTLTPQIWKYGLAGDILVYAGEPKTCVNTKECRLNGTFIPLWDISNVTATYFANVTTSYDLITETAAANPTVPNKYIMVYKTRKNIPVPEVIVTSPLSPLEPGKVVDAANANNTVPWGGTIEHVMDGDVPMTVVYNASGQPQFRADDRKNVNINRPDGKNQSATFIHVIPNGSIVAHIINIGNSAGELVEVHQNNEKVMSSVNRLSGSALPDVPDVAYNGWIEWADDANTDNVTKVSARWKVPGVPVRQTTGLGLAIFNSIRPKDRSRILQPVLEWNYRGYQSFSWTSCPWDYTSSTTRDTWAGYRHPVKVGDVLEGEMTWDSTKNGWNVKMHDVTDGNVSSFLSTNVSTNLDLSTELALEVSTEQGIDKDDEFCKNIVFDTLVYKNASGDAPVTLTKHINQGPKSKFPLLDVVITTDSAGKPTKVELQTPRGV